VHPDARLLRPALALALVLCGISTASAGVLRLEGAYAVPASNHDGAWGAGGAYLKRLGERAQLGFGMGYRKLDRSGGGATSYGDLSGLLYIDLVHAGQLHVSSNYGLGTYMVTYFFTEEAQAHNDLIPSQEFRQGLGAQLGLWVDYRPEELVGGFLGARLHMVALDFGGEGFMELVGGFHLRLGSP